MVSYLYTDDVAAMQFTANGAVSQITLTPDVADDIRLNIVNNVGNFSRRYFQYADNIIIESVQLILPYCFNVGLNPSRFAIQLVTKAGVGGGFISGFGLNGVEPTEPNQLINSVSWLGVNDLFTLNIVDSFFSISQIGIPTELEATTQSIFLMFKIKHTLGLLA